MAYEIADLPAHLQASAMKQLAAPKAEAAAKPKDGSALEERFAGLITRYGLPAPIREYVYAPPRKFRSDFCWLDARVLVEMEGGVWGKKSGHNSGVGIERDCERSRLATLHGFRVFRVTRKSLDESEATVMEHLRKILEVKQA